jgi:tetratricopeptide (TPR) repeat protein
MAQILATLAQAGNPETRSLLDVTVCFILRAAMTLHFKLRASQLLLSVAVFLVCGLAGAPEALAQRLPKATGREPENKPASPRRESRHKYQPAPAASRSPASVESNNFFDLGERFREQEKWKAAEAAYKEAVAVWPGNTDALTELGFLYLDRNRLDEAQQIYVKLRSLNASYASELLAEINRRKATLAH